MKNNLFKLEPTKFAGMMKLEIMSFLVYRSISEIVYQGDQDFVTDSWLFNWGSHRSAEVLNLRHNLLNLQTEPIDKL